MSEEVSEKTAAEVPVSDPNRFKALFVIAIAQLMIVLDASIVNLAIPSAQADLGIEPQDVQWVVTAYTLAFGGFLLLGGRIADFMGRKRTFIVGLLGFALASLLGGLAMNSSLLFGARALQGVFAALLAPAALALITPRHIRQVSRGARTVTLPSSAFRCGGSPSPSPTSMASPMSITGMR